MADRKRQIERHVKGMWTANGRVGRSDALPVNLARISLRQLLGNSVGVKSTYLSSG